VRLLFPPDNCPHFLFEVGFFGQKYRGDLAHFIDWVVFFYGSYAMPELSLLRACAEAIRSRRKGPVLFLDIGANVGHHSLFMAPFADQVVSFEPFPPLQAQIQEKIALNNLANVTIVPFGLGEKDAVSDYHPGPDGNSGTGSFVSDDNGRNASPVKLLIKQGDSVLEQLGAGKIDLIKMDVEGFEAAVLRGLAHRIQSDHPVILMELGSDSRQRFGSEQGFRQVFYPEARFAAVGGRLGCNYELRPFDYARDREVLIVPSEMEWLSEALLKSN
jgi:FkbM family methyltransferase